MWLECETCGNREREAATCKTCGGRGRIRVEGCVKKQIKPGAWSLLTACYRAENHKWPNGGGWLDETAVFLRAVDWVANEKSRVEKEIAKTR